ncbi:MAG: PTS system mannose/fructose/sorbose family transporter subunit IID [Erysipelotrichaceae bacterium]|nr:PTS system mannose/fructose/sorbose family transporter subunit IID [Erysipelotrichaceae bacterium]
MAQTNKKLSKGTLSKACARHNWALQWCWNYEKMQASGYAYAMVPVFKELYDDNDEICRNLERHMAFYNTHPGASALIFGADVALEEAYQGETGDSLKVALMGPMAGIGDTIQAVLVTPPFNIIGASAAAAGNYVMAIACTTLPLVALFCLRWPLFNYGYKTGVNVINDVSGAGTLTKFQEMASILGITVVGGFVPSMIGTKFNPDFLKTTLTNEAGEVIKESSVGASINSTLDAILPKALAIAFVALCWYLLKKKKWTPVKVILLLCVIGFIGGFFGLLA